VARSVQQILMTALIRLEQAPGLSPEEIEWVRRHAIRLMTDFTVAQSAGLDEESLDRESRNHPVAA
jgi:hypothetical protein